MVISPFDNGLNIGTGSFCEKLNAVKRSGGD